MVPREARLTNQTARATVVSVQQVTQPAVEVRTSIEAMTSSIEAAAPLVSIPFTLVFFFLYVFICILTYSSYSKLKICQRVLGTLTNFLKMSH